MRFVRQRRRATSLRRADVAGGLVELCVGDGAAVDHDGRFVVARSPPARRVRWGSRFGVTSYARWHQPWFPLNKVALRLAR
jgi:hypothetical protein